MNVALPALIVFLIVLPGFIFRTRVKRVERTSLDYSPFWPGGRRGRLMGSIRPSVVACALVFDFSPSARAGRAHEVAFFRSLGQARAAEAVGRDFGRISAYFVTLLFASLTIPKALRSIISTYRLDRDAAPLSSVFRFHQAPWYYLLTGADFNKGEEPDFIVISAIVEVGGSAVLYMGVLNEFFVNADGQLDRLVLRGVARRPIASDKPAAMRAARRSRRGSMTSMAITS